jgi:N utilization substance protein B
MSTSTPKKGPGQFAQRRDGRIAALLYLYRWSSNRPTNLADDIRAFFEELASEQVAITGAGEDNDFLKAMARPREHYAFGEELIQGALAHLDDIDQRIQQLAQNWEFDRIAKIDLAILRLAIFEMVYRKDIPPVVSINEAIEIAKKYSTEESGRFVNGVLDKIRGGLNRPARTVSQS